MIACGRFGVQFIIEMAYIILEAFVVIGEHHRRGECLHCVLKVRKIADSSVLQKVKVKQHWHRIIFQIWQFHLRHGKDNGSPDSVDLIRLYPVYSSACILHFHRESFCEGHRRQYDMEIHRLFRVQLHSVRTDKSHRRGCIISHPHDRSIVMVKHHLSRAGKFLTVLSCQSQGSHSIGTGQTKFQDPEDIPELQLIICQR